MATTKQQMGKPEAKPEPKEERKSYSDHLIELEEGRFAYRVLRRELINYRNIVLVVVFLFIALIVTVYLVGFNNGFYGWFILLDVLLFFCIIGLIFFFCIPSNENGFGGLEKGRQLSELKKDIEQEEIFIRILEEHQETLLTIDEKTELYKDTLRQVIEEYQRKANRNRWTYFIIQMIIIGCSLLVGGLTSGLSSFISIFGNHLLAPILSFTVSFLTAIITLFRPRERGFNLQQTADAIQYEIDCATMHIFGYKGLSTEDRYIRLSEEVERMRNEQRKRQQQLEQASDVRQANT